MTRTVLTPGIALNCVTTKRFKTNILSAYFLRRLDASEAALNALLPQVMRQGNKNNPDLRSMSDALADLYGATLPAVVQKRGEWHCFGLASSFIGGNLHGVAAMLCETLFEPVFGSYVESERGNLINRIRALKNDKAAYADQRLDALAFAGEPYAVGRLGDENTAAAITRPLLEAHYQNVLKTSRIELFYCGDAIPDEAAALLSQFLESIERNFTESPVLEYHHTPKPSRTFTEYENVTQSKLVIMWRTGAFTERHDFLSAYTAAVIYGGDAGKLFSNVRERLSLCYYADARLDRHKCIIKARSGVETSNIGRARDEMLAQWEAVAKGEFTDADLAHAKATMLNAWKSAGDSPAALESFWQGQAAAGLTDSLDDWISELGAIQKEDVVDAAVRFSLDSVYCLRAE